MSPAQTPSPTAADRCEQPDQIVAAGGARPDELETPAELTHLSEIRGPPHLDSPSTLAGRTARPAHPRIPAQCSVRLRWRSIATTSAGSLKRGKPPAANWSRLGAGKPRREA